MKFRRPILIFLAVALLMTGCSSPQPAMTGTTTVITTPAPTVAPGDGPAMERAASALDGWIPDGLKLVQTRTGDVLERRLVPEKGDGALLLESLALVNGEWTGYLIPEALTDQTFMKSACILAESGLTLNLTHYGQHALRSDMLELMVGLIESTGYVIDAGLIDEKYESELMRKALEMDLEDCSALDHISETSYLSQGLAEYDFQLIVTAAVRALESRVLLRAGLSTTLQDAAELWPLITGMNAAPFAGSNGDMNRLDLALAFMDAYKAYYAVTGLPEGASSAVFADVDRKYTGELAFIEFYHLMDSYPDYTSFSPEQPVRMDKLPELINTFYLAFRDGPSVYTAEYEEYDENEPSGGFDTVYTRMATFQDVVNRTAALYQHYKDDTLPRSTIKEVINLPDHSIYVNQQDGSEYAAVNCMPAMVCMVLKWNMPYSSVTPDELRQKSRRSGGWHMGIVHDQLEDYGIPYTTAEPTRNNIVKALDEGKLVLCQFNAWDLDESGHCYIIVGYRRQGGALWFCVEDPEGEAMGKYGRPANDQTWLEAEDALWSINRFVDEITLVDPESAEITNE